MYVHSLCLHKKKHPANLSQISKNNEVNIILLSLQLSSLCAIPSRLYRPFNDHNWIELQKLIAIANYVLCIYVHIYLYSYVLSRVNDTITLATIEMSCSHSGVITLCTSQHITGFKGKKYLIALLLKFMQFVERMTFVP